MGSPRWKTCHECAAGEHLKPLFHSPKGLFPHQEDAAPIFALRPNNLVLWSGGIGKTVAFIVTACLLFEDGLIDHAVVCCESSKIQGLKNSDLADGWVDEFRRFSDLETAAYHGADRKTMLSALPQVMVSTYETFRNDSMVIVPNKRGKKEKKLGPFGLALDEKRVLIAYDEIDLKLGGSRTSQTYKAHEFLAKNLRKRGEYRSFGFTATPLSTSPVNVFNYVRLMDPDAMPTVAEFEKNYIGSWDFFGNPKTFKNIEIAEEPGVTPFVDLIAHMVHVKHKSDPDVAPFFPSRTEKFLWVELTPKQKDFYKQVQELLQEATEEEIDINSMILQQISCHPLSLLRSKAPFVKEIVEVLGEERLRALGSGKSDRLVELLRPVERQGDQAIVFTWFESAIAFIQEDLIAAGLTVSIHHGKQTGKQKQQALHDFRSKNTQVLISSDAGSRGINLPGAAHCFNYELPEHFSTYTQRIERNSRLTSVIPSVRVRSLIARGTVEEKSANRVYKRNKWTDEIAPGAKITAAVRRAWIREGR